jgi:hypothetical protein
MDNNTQEHPDSGNATQAYNIFSAHMVSSISTYRPFISIIPLTNQVKRVNIAQETEQIRHKHLIKTSFDKRRCL